MNCDRGLRRVVLVLSIVGAIWGAASCYRDMKDWHSARTLPSPDIMQFVGEMVAGAIFGFCSVWAVYAACKWVAWPAYKWIALGFHEDEQKDDADE